MAAPTKSMSDMKARIADELARADLTSQIAIAIEDAILAYEDERFLFNEKRFDFPTVQDQEFYDVNDNSNLGILNKVDYMFLYNNGPTPWELDYKPPDYMEWVSQNGTFKGQPYEYTWYNNQFRLFPIPNAVYTIRTAVAFQFPAPTDDADPTNPWMNIAERLIRNRAKLELALHVLRNPDMIALLAGPTFLTDGVIKGSTGEAFKQLKSRTNELTQMGDGYIRPMDF